jgi:hypothetical protein
MYAHEDDKDVTDRIALFMEYAAQHVPSTIVSLHKQSPTRTYNKVMIDKSLEWKRVKSITSQSKIGHLKLPRSQACHRSRQLAVVTLNLL